MNLDEKEYTVSLLEVKKIIKDIYTFKFSKPKVTWSEGTNVHIAFKDYKAHEKKKYVRHFSITNLDHEPFISFTTRLSSSPFKERLMSLKPGDEMFMYKFKNRMKVRFDKPQIVLLSMGVGLAAFNSMIELLKVKEDHLKVININVSKDENLYADHYRTLDFLKNHYVNNRRDFYQSIDETYNKNNVYYIVGSDAFLQGLVAYLIKKGHAAELIEMDKKEKKKKTLLAS